MASPEAASAAFTLSDEDLVASAVEVCCACCPDDFDVWNSFSPASRMKSMSAMASPFIDGWNCCNTTGKNFLPIPTSGDKAAARLSLLLEMHESGHVRHERAANPAVPANEPSLDSAASSVIV